ncbi:MAG: TetR/AcrR family transcriptional regulator [Sediminibacterium sp.]|jgi:TetR/AcrR family transcriptional regulator|nr:MAG: TetR/AcrR family transcriptional regulator [Sediminibacterium sp.] [Sediminibacterium sp. FEMGT703S]
MVKNNIDTEQVILNAAKKLFSAKGKDGTAMQEIADEAGINKALLHYYFRNKDKLFEEVFLDAVKKFSPFLKSTISEEMPLFQKINLISEAYIKMAIEHPFVPVFILSEVNKQPELLIQKMFNGELPNFPVFAKQIEAEIEKGTIKPIQPQQLILNIISLSIFPFVFKPIFLIGMKKTKKEFNQLMQDRIQLVPQFIIDSIKK